MNSKYVMVEILVASLGKYLKIVLRVVPIDNPYKDMK